MQRRDAIKAARALVVLSSDRWTKVLEEASAQPVPTEKLQE